MWVYCLTTKDQTLFFFFLFYFIKLFLVTIERKFGKKLKGKYADNGDEYREPFIEYYKNLRIKFKKFMLKIP